MPKAGFISLGCPKNLVDSEVMMGILARNGYEFTPRAEEAEVLVVNTCSFIAPAQKESIDTILEMAEYKKFGVAKKLIVAGCLVERYRAANPRTDSRSRRRGRHGRNRKHSGSRRRRIAIRCGSCGSPAFVSLSRPHAAHSLDAEACRVHQDRRRLRSSLHVLHHSAVARKIPQPPI